MKIFHTHNSSRSKNWRLHYDGGYFYDGIDLPPSVGRVNIRDFKYDKYCAQNLTRVRLVDNSALAKKAMKWYRTPRIIQVYHPNQGHHLGARRIRGTRQYPTKVQHGRIGSLYGKFS